MSRSSLRTRKGCAGVSCELWWTKIKRSQRKSHSGMLQQIAWWKTVFFPLSLTTSSGQNAQIQAETTCWSQQGCLSLDFDACVTNGKQNPTGKDPHKCLRASPYTGAGSLSEIRLSKCVFKNPPWSTIAKLSASVPGL